MIKVNQYKYDFDSASFASRLRNLETASVSSGSFISVSVFNTFTSSGYLGGTASYALTASYLLGSVESASYSATASYLLGSVQSASFAETASYVILAQTSSYSFSSSFDGTQNSRLTGLESYTSSLNNKTSSFATTGSNQFNGNQNITGSLLVSGSNVDFSQTTSITGSIISASSITGSLFGTSSFANNSSTASYALTASMLLGTVQSASYASNADLLDGKDSSIFATTGSNIFKNNQTITGSVKIDGSMLPITSSVKTPLYITSDSITRVDINNSSTGSFNVGVSFYNTNARKWSIASFGTNSDFSFYNDALFGSAFFIQGLTSNLIMGSVTGESGYKLTVTGSGVSGSFKINNTLRHTGSLFILTGSLLVTGSISANSLTGSLLGTASNASTASYAISDIKVFKPITASYTLVISDAYKALELFSGSANIVTVPSSASVNFNPGTEIIIIQSGSGQTSITGSSGVTIYSSGGALKLSSSFSVATLLKKQNDQWYLYGDIVV